MAKIVRDALVLTDEEQERLRKNLLNPSANPERERFLIEIENLECKKEENGFFVRFDEVNL